VPSISHGGGLEAHARQLAWSLNTYLDRDGHWQDWATTMTNAVAAADHLGHPAPQAVAHRFLAHALVQQDRLDEAVHHLEDALRLFRDIGDSANYFDLKK